MRRLHYLGNFLFTEEIAAFDISENILKICFIYKKTKKKSKGFKKRVRITPFMADAYTDEILNSMFLPII